MGISLDAVTQIVSITSPTAEVTIQTLLDTIRVWEAELPHMTDPPVLDGDGKTDLTGKDGNLVGGVGDQPIKPTGGTDTIIVNNQVGGVIIVTGSGVTAQDKLDIADAVADESLSGHTTVGTLGKAITDIDSDVTALLDESGGRWHLTGNQLIVYKADNLAELMRFNLTDSSGNPTMTDVMQRTRV